MSDQPDAVVIMQGPHPDLERAAQRLSDRGIDAAIVCPDQNAGSS